MYGMVLLANWVFPSEMMEGVQAMRKHFLWKYFSLLWMAEEGFATVPLDGKDEKKVRC